MAAPPRPSPSSPLTTVLGGHIRAASARYRLPRVLVAVVVAMAGASIVARAQSHAADAAAAWQPSAPVLVVVQPIEAGAPIPAEAITRRPVPEGLRPADALHDLPDGARATAALAPGEILRSARLHHEAASALAALLPHDQLAFRIAADGLDATPGDTVRLYDLATGRIVVGAALVLIRDDASITVAVPEREAPDLIGALGGGGVVAAITQPLPTEP